MITNIFLSSHVAVVHLTGRDGIVSNLSLCFFQVVYVGKMIVGRPPSLFQVQSRLFANPRSSSIGINGYSLRQTRTFIDSLLSSTLGPCPLRSLTHTKRLPYPPGLIFKAVSDVSGYPTFLPFTISSHVTSRDEAGYPTRARLKVGYEKFGLEEDWDSIVSCDPERGLVEARSSDQNSNGLFEVLNTKWHIAPTDSNSSDGTSVKLDVDVRFRNPIYDQMFSQVEGKVASTMISAFEKRVEELHHKRGK